MSQTKMFGFERSKDGKDEWLTPLWILEELGPFDLDPCAPITRPWEMAENHYTVEDNGLIKPWEGRTWCNPPYSSAGPWLARMAEHNHGTALMPARTETLKFFKWVWPKASGLLFIKGRLTFHHVDGRAAKSGAGFPSVLIAYGKEDAKKLASCNIPGAYVVCQGLTCTTSTA